MNNNKNKISLVASVIISVVMSLNVNAQELPISTLNDSNGESVHKNLHDFNTARYQYNTWKVNGTSDNDPFKRIAQGYKIEKDFSKTEYVNDVYEPSVTGFIEISIENKDALVEDRKSFRDEQMSFIYEMSLEEDKVNTKTFSEEYSLFLEEKGNRASTYYELRQAEIASVGIDTNENNVNQNNFTAERSHNATRNLLNVISTENQSQKTLIQDIFADNLAMVEQSGAYAQDAVRLASELSDDCPACELPQVSQPITPLPIIDPEPDPTPIFTPPVDRCLMPDRKKYWEYYRCP